VKTKTLLFTILLCGIAGILFFLVQRKWIIVQWTFNSPHITSIPSQINKQNSVQKPVKLYYWKKEKWHQEEATILWLENNSAQNLKLLIKQWLTLQQDEHIVSPHCLLESVAVSSLGNEAYISFDRTLFSKEWPIIKKWLLLTSLFKTINQAAPVLQSLTLLVHYQIMDDDHLDLSQPLPIQDWS
jgi:hypothetical protein